MDTVHVVFALALICVANASSSMFLCDDSVHSPRQCCPGKMGQNCTVDDLCFRKDAENACANGGVCDPLTGKCVCPAEYAGPTCKELTCSDNGVYDVSDERCHCKEGWTGHDCSECRFEPAGEEEDRRYVCFPVGDGYVLWSMERAMLDRWMDGATRSLMESVRGTEFDSIAIPAHRDAKNRYVDCECRVIPDTVQSRMDAMGPESRATHNSALNGIASYRRSQQARTQVAVFEQAVSLRRQIQEARRSTHIPSILHSAALQRLGLLAENTRIFRRDMDTTNRVLLRDSIRESKKQIQMIDSSQKERSQLANVYAECVDNYDRVTKNLEVSTRALDMCKDPNVENQDCTLTCERFTTAFYVLLGISITLCFIIISTIVILLIASAFPPGRLRRST